MLLEKNIETEEDLVDVSTGEVLTTTVSRTKQTFKRKANYENYVQLYIEDLSNIYRIKSRTQVALLIVLCQEHKLLHRKTQGEELPTFTALIDDKARWAEKLDISPGKNIDNALAELVKRNIVLRISRGKYAINPKYVFSGALKDRPEAVEISIKYEIFNQEDPSSN